MQNFETNYLLASNFVFKIADAPHVEYFTQRVSIPGMNLGRALVPTPFVKLQEAGELEYDDLRIDFLVNESLDGYLEIFNWLVELGHPDSLSQYKNRRSDLSVIILNGSKRPMINVKLTNAFPTNISSIDLDIATTPEDRITASATFNFDRIYFNKI